jgi:hypothetical protein
VIEPDGAVYLNEHCVIPPFQEVEALVRVHGQTGTIEIYPNTKSKNHRSSLWRVANSVADVNGSREILIRLANFSDETIQVPTGTKVAHTRKVDRILNIQTQQCTREDEKIRTETLQCIIESLKYLDDNERELVHEMLEDHIELWTKELGDIKCKEPFHIYTTEGSAVHSQPYRAGPAERESIRKEVERM